MRAQFAVCAQTAIIDRASNQLSLLNIVDQLQVLTFPHILPTLTFVAILQGDSQTPSRELLGAFEVHNNRTLVAKDDVPVTFTNGRLARVILNMSGLHIGESGFLKFSMRIPDQLNIDLSIDVLDLNRSAAFQPHLF